MEKYIKNILIILGVIIGIIILDTIQALVFDNNPMIGIQTRGMKKEGILVDTYHCGNGEHDTVIKGFSYSCSYKGGNYTLVDKTKEIKDTVCATMLEEFYQDENYIYYWDCIKGYYMIVKYDNGYEETISEALKQGYYMIVKYDNGYEETISEALKQGHIDIQDLDKFDIDYIKEEK